MGSGDEGRVRLAPLRLVEIPAILNAIRSYPDLVQWTGPTQFTYPLTEEQLRRYIESVHSGEPDTRLLRAIDQDGVSLGVIEIGMVNRANESGSLCRVLVFPPHRARGVCTPMVREALRIAFEELGLRRVDLRVYAFNKPAIRCYERAGMTIEGVLRKGQKVGDATWDTVLMAILREEWSGADA
jgi:RimJ/RimL family protein N-acetyltransferase